MSKKRAAALLLALLVWCAGLPAMAQEQFSTALRQARTWPLVAQNAEFYAQNPDYYYYNNNLWSTGCGPCSIANALIAVFDVTDEATAQQVMLETLYLMAEGHAPSTNLLEITQIGLLADASMDEYPTLSRLRGQLGQIVYTNHTITIDDVKEQAEAAYRAGKPALLIARTRAADQWSDYVQMCRWLSSVGLDDAMLVTCYMSGGTESLESPFGSGNAGHYLSLLIHVGDFLRDGTVYLLDSLPRGLSRSEKDERGYSSIYPFAALYSCKSLRESYRITRLQDTVLRFSLTGEAQKNCTGADELANRARYLSLLTLVGRGLMLVYLP